MYINIKGVCKTICQKVLLKDFNLWIQTGELHCILGLSGSGKTLLAEVLSGIQSMDSGVIRLDETIMHPYTLKLAQQKGIYLIQKQTSLFTNLTVSENLSWFDTPNKFLRIRHPKKERQGAKKKLARYAVLINLDLKLNELSLCDLHRVEIIKYMHMGAGCLILDDIMSTYTQKEIKQLSTLLRLVQAQGISILIMSKQMGPYLKDMDYVHILNHGSLIFSVDKSSYQDHLIRNILTQKQLTTTLSQNYIKNAVVFNYSNKRKSLHWSIRAGEVLGFGIKQTGLTHMMMQQLMGEVHTQDVEMILNNEPYEPQNIKDAVHKGVGWLSFNQDMPAFFEHMTILENLCMHVLPEISNRFGIISNSRFSCALEILCKKIPDLRDIAHVFPSHLKAFQKQNLLIQRWATSQVQVLIFIHPISSTDESHQASVIDAIHEMANRNIAVIVVESEIEHLMKCCHRYQNF